MRSPTQSLHSKLAWDRILIIHQRLQSGSYPNAKALAAQMEVSERTILRDLAESQNQPRPSPPNTPDLPLNTEY